MLPYLTDMMERVSGTVLRGCHSGWGREGPHLTHGGLDSQSVGCGQTGQSWVPNWKKGLDTGFQKIKQVGQGTLTGRKENTYLLPEVAVGAPGHHPTLKMMVAPEILGMKHCSQMLT